MVKVNCKATPFMGMILAGNGKEVKKFEGVSSIERIRLEAETYQRMYLNEALGTSSSWEAGEAYLAKKDNINIANSIRNNCVCLISKKKATVVVKEVVNLTKTFKIGKETKKIPTTEIRDKKVQEPKAMAFVSFRFDSNNSVLVVNIESIVAKDFATEEYFRKDLEKNLTAAATQTEKKFCLSGFVKAFFDTLKANRFCNISGNEALNMMRIYNNAKRTYPLFAELEYTKQIDILDKGYRNACKVSSANRDIYVLAKSAFLSMYEAGYADKVYKLDFISNRIMLHTKIGEHRKDRRNPERPSQIWEKNSLIFVDYVYGGSNLRTSILASELWNLLVSKEGEVAVA